MACLGLSRALAELVDLRVVVPRAAPDAGVRRLPADRAEQPDGRRTWRRSRSATATRVSPQIERVPIHLDPYASGEETTLERGAARRAGAGRVRAAPARRSSSSSRSATCMAATWAPRWSSFRRWRRSWRCRSEFDLVHAHDWMTFLAGVEVKKATGKPLVVHVHASHYDRAGPDARGWIFEIEKYGMEQADRVIPVSRYTGEIVARHYGIDPRQDPPGAQRGGAGGEFRDPQEVPGEAGAFPRPADGAEGAGVLPRDRRQGAGAESRRALRDGGHRGEAAAADRERGVPRARRALPLHRLPQQGEGRRAAVDDRRLLHALGVRAVRVVGAGGGAVRDPGGDLEAVRGGRGARGRAARRTSGMSS